MKREELDHVNVLNFAAKCLARHARAGPVGYAEPWRFPLIQGHEAAGGGPDTPESNLVTFVWVADAASDTTPVAVVGTFDNLWDSTPLETVMLADEPTRYRAASVLVPVGEVHTYKLMVGGRPLLDPINPQRTVLDNGAEWSRFFTERCAVPLSFERWELAILLRLTNEILPFQSKDAQKFMDLYYFRLPPSARGASLAQAYRLEQPVGAVNFIDKLVAREESHRLIDYKICLRIIAGLLRARFPGVAPAEVSRQAYADLYAEMASNNVPGWDFGQYGSPQFFLQLLRRHTYTGAFSHPKYGGNAGGAGWAYLEEMFRGPNGEVCFDWRRSIEQPLGDSNDYRG